MYDSVIYLSNGNYLEADSRLSAMQTFLMDLHGNPAAQPLLLSLAGEFEQFLNEALEEYPCSEAKPQELQHSFQVLKQTIDELPTTATEANETAWDRAQKCLQNLQDQFSRYLKQLKACGNLRHAQMTPA